MSVVLFIVYFTIGGALGQAAALTLGMIAGAVYALVKMRGKALLWCVVLTAVLFWVVIPLLLLAAGTVGDHTGYRMQWMLMPAMILGFLGSWFWLAMPVVAVRGVSSK